MLTTSLCLVRPLAMISSQLAHRLAVGGLDVADLGLESFFNCGHRDAGPFAVTIIG